MRNSSTSAGRSGAASECLKPRPTRWPLTWKRISQRRRLRASHPKKCWATATSTPGPSPPPGRHPVGFVRRTRSARGTIQVRTLALALGAVVAAAFVALGLALLFGTPVINRGVVSASAAAPFATIRRFRPFSSPRRVDTLPSLGRCRRRASWRRVWSSCSSGSPRWAQSSGSGVRGCAHGADLPVSTRTSGCPTSSKDVIQRRM